MYFDLFWNMIVTDNMPRLNEDAEGVLHFHSSDDSKDESTPLRKTDSTKTKQHPADVRVAAQLRKIIGVPNAQEKTTSQGNSVIYVHNRIQAITCT